MAEEKVEARELNWRQLLPFTELFRGFQVALDLNKLLLAAAGIFVMAFGWWLLALLFSSGYSKEPKAWGSEFRKDVPEGDTAELKKKWAIFKAERDNWNLMNEAADLAGSDKESVWEVDDLAESVEEYDLFKGVKSGKEYLARVDVLAQEQKDGKRKDFDEAKRKEYVAKERVYARLGQKKPAGRLATWPWSEDRGPNPFLLVSGQTGIPWEPGHFWDWFTTHQVPVLIEPLAKLVRPILYFLSPRANGFVPRLYFFLAFVWTVLTWSVFGGAITRIAAVQVARGEKIGLTEALRFTFKRLLSYVTPPLFPLGFVFVLVIFAVIFGLFGMIPVFGDVIVSGLLWIVPLILGLVMAVFLVGLAVGWPLMAPTISTEGTDSWEAVSRSFSYIFQKPGHYFWYCLVAVAYGAVVVFLVGFLGSFTVYMGKWAVARTPFIETANREPSYLFVYTPTSFGWRTLLLDGAKVDGVNVVENGQINKDAYNRYMGGDKDYQDKPDTLRVWNKVGAFLVACWLGLVFLLILGFGYSFYFTSSTIIYLLMRKNVDAAELDEVYLEEDDLSGSFAGSLTPPPAPPAPASKPSQPVTMVEPPTFKAPSAPSTPPPPPPPPPPPVAPSEPPPTDGASNPPTTS